MSIPNKTAFRDKPWECSFARVRGGRPLKDSQAALMRDMLPKRSVRLPEKQAESLEELVAGASTFPQGCGVEIGFGAGEHVLAMARQQPGRLWIGCEPYLHGMASCLSALEKEHAPNLWLHHGDGRDVLCLMPDACVDEAYILFPDPWPKKRHHKRRIVEPALLCVLARVMKPGGVLWLATDIEDYAEWMMEKFLQEPEFRWDAPYPVHCRIQPEGWVVTRYQAWAQEEGRQPWFFRLVRQ
ncbi:tRNA (guanosine(46)-N7)-methyltransferase TrmB [bacterium]|nr:tRNA (guanosine(46)-N7)-methyltransferase TrmB [bacterium]